MIIVYALGAVLFACTAGVVILAALALAAVVGRVVRWVYDINEGDV